MAEPDAPLHVCPECFAQYAGDLRACPACGVPMDSRGGARRDVRPVPVAEHGARVPADHSPGVAVDQQPERWRRAVPWVMGLAVVAAAVGLAVRSADDGDGERAGVGAAETSTTSASSLPGTTGPASGPPSSPASTPVTRHSRVTTEAPLMTSDPLPTTTEPHGPYLLAPTGTHLLVADDDDLVEIDLDTGEERIIAENLGNELFPGSGVVDGEWYVSVSGRPALAIPLAGGAPVELGEACGGFRSATPGRWWLSSCSQEGTSYVTEVELSDGTVTSELRPPAATRVLFDTADGLVLEAGGGVYIGRDSDWRRVATGGVGGVLGRVVLLNECDEALVCTTSVFDPLTGERRALPEREDEGGILAGYGGTVSGEAVGRAVVVLYGRGTLEYGVFDQTSDELFPLPDSGMLETAVLSPDGQWVFWTFGAQARAWRVGDETMSPIDLDGRTLVTGY